MNATHGWLPGAPTAWIVLSVFAAAVLAHAVWRSRGEGEPDPVRTSGPIL
jgi:hypothetical protein